MKKKMLSVEEVVSLLGNGACLALAGDERVLNQLPKGNWIGGTIPYFMGDNGGLFTQNMIYVDSIPDIKSSFEIKVYNKESIRNIYSESPVNGYSITIFPAACETLSEFSQNSPNYEGFATSPIAGWASGVFLDELGKVSPKVFNGQDGAVYEDGCVVLSVELPENYVADIEIVNLFEQGEGDIFTFEETGFTTTYCYVNGEKKHLRTYLNENHIDIRFPLVGDAYGALMNVSFQAGTENQDDVAFYAPVFKGMEYRLAKPIHNYVDDFIKKLPEYKSDTFGFSCNCILNYLYSELEGKKTADLTGPMTFGEIAYQLLNQTMVYLSVTKI